MRQREREFSSSAVAADRGLDRSDRPLWTERAVPLASGPCDDWRGTLKAAVSDRARPGVVIAPSVWWKKLSPDGRNANDVTSQRIADLGGGATFYDCLVEVSLASPAP